MSEPQGRSSRQRYREFRQQKAWTKRQDEVTEASPLPTADYHGRKGYLRQYRDIVRPFRKAVVLLIVLGFIAAALEMVVPLIAGLLIDHVLLNDALVRSQKLMWLGIAGGLGILLVLSSRGLDTWRNISTIRLNHKMIVRLRRRLHRHLLKLPLRDIQEMKSGLIVSRLSGDVDKAMGLLQMAVMSPVAAAWRVIIASVILFAWNWKLALVAWAVLPPMMIISLLWIKQIRPIFRSAGRDRNLIDARATETFGGIRVVRTFRREHRERRDYTVADDTMIRKHLFGRGLGLVVDSAWQLLIPLSGLLVVFIGGYLYITGADTTIGQIQAFQIYSVRLLFPIFGIISSLNRTQESLAAIERVFEVFDMPPDKPDRPNAVEAPSHVDRFEFDHVWFSYNPGTPVLRDVSFSVEGGSVVALVGPSGAGKTTITDLIARFYDIDEGTIRLNGRDIRDIKLDSYRRLLAVVPQETFLFDGSVRENIAYGRRGVHDAQVIEAAERANAMQFIRDLPDGLDTIIGERGVKLSGGQRQRVSIARAILADPRILILDEATSNLDTESEQLIQSALDDLYHNRTTFVIAHRLSTVTHADLIVVIGAGQVIESGTHEQLMAAEGAYYDMVQRQHSFDTVGE